MEKLQRRACKIILGKEYVTLEDALQSLNFLSFEEIIFINKAKLMYKIANNIAPIYLTEMFQMRDSNNTTFNLRSVSNKNFTIPKPKLNIFKRSLSYSGALVWNSIPVEIKNADTIGSFVSKCLRWVREDNNV